MIQYSVPQLVSVDPQLVPVAAPMVHDQEKIQFDESADMALSHMINGIPTGNPFPGTYTRPKNAVVTYPVKRMLIFDSSLNAWINCDVSVYETPDSMAAQPPNANDMKYLLNYGYGNSAHGLSFYKQPLATKQYPAPPKVFVQHAFSNNHQTQYLGNPLAQSAPFAQKEGLPNSPPGSWNGAQPQTQNALASKNLTQQAPSCKNQPTQQPGSSQTQNAPLAQNKGLTKSQPGSWNEGRPQNRGHSKTPPQESNGGHSNSPPGSWDREQYQSNPVTSKNQKQSAPPSDNQQPQLPGISQAQNAPLVQNKVLAKSQPGSWNEGRPQNRGHSKSPPHACDGGQTQNALASKNLTQQTPSCDNRQTQHPGSSQIQNAPLVKNREHSKSPPFAQNKGHSNSSPESCNGEQPQSQNNVTSKNQTQHARPENQQSQHLGHPQARNAPLVQNKGHSNSPPGSWNEGQPQTQNVLASKNHTQQGPSCNNQQTQRLGNSQLPNTPLAQNKGLTKSQPGSWNEGRPQNRGHSKSPPQESNGEHSNSPPGSWDGGQPQSNPVATKNRKQSAPPSDNQQTQHPEISKTQNAPLAQNKGLIKSQPGSWNEGRPQNRGHSKSPPQEWNGGYPYYQPRRYHYNHRYQSELEYQLYGPHNHYHNSSYKKNNKRHENQYPAAHHNHRNNYYNQNRVVPEQQILSEMQKGQKHQQNIPKNKQNIPQNQQHVQKQQNQNLPDKMETIEEIAEQEYVEFQEAPNSTTVETGCYVTEYKADVNQKELQEIPNADKLEVAIDTEEVQSEAQEVVAKMDDQDSDAKFDEAVGGEQEKTEEIGKDDGSAAATENSADSKPSAVTENAIPSPPSNISIENVKSADSGVVVDAEKASSSKVNQANSQPTKPTSKKSKKSNKKYVKMPIQFGDFEFKEVAPECSYRKKSNQEEFVDDGKFSFKTYKAKNFPVLNEAQKGQKQLKMESSPVEFELSGSVSTIPENTPETVSSADQESSSKENFDSSVAVTSPEVKEASICQDSTSKEDAAETLKDLDSIDSVQEVADIIETKEPLCEAKKPEESSENLDAIDSLPIDIPAIPEIQNSIGEATNQDAQSVEVKSEGSFNNNLCGYGSDFSDASIVTQIDVSLIKRNEILEKESVKVENGGDEMVKKTDDSDEKQELTDNDDWTGVWSEEEEEEKQKEIETAKNDAEKKEMEENLVAETKVLDRETGMEAKSTGDEHQQSQAPESHTNGTNSYKQHKSAIPKDAIVVDYDDTFPSLGSVQEYPKKSYNKNVTRGRGKRDFQNPARNGQRTNYTAANNFSNFDYSYYGNDYAQRQNGQNGNRNSQNGRQNSQNNERYGQNGRENGHNERENGQTNGRQYGQNNGGQSGRQYSSENSQYGQRNQNSGQRYGQNERENSQTNGHQYGQNNGRQYGQNNGGQYGQSGRLNYQNGSQRGRQNSPNSRQFGQRNERQNGHRYYEDNNNNGGYKSRYYSSNKQAENPGNNSESIKSKAG